MSVSVRQGLAVLGVAVVAVAAPATAFAAGHGGHGGHHGKSGTHQNHGQHGKSATHPNHKHHGKPSARRFTATGTYDGAGTDGGTFTMDDKGGSRDLHGQLAVVITVSSTTKVTRNDAPATLGDLVQGDHVAVNGLRGANGELDALHVNAEGPPVPAPQPSSSSSPGATDSPTPSPTDSSAAPSTGP